MRMVYCKLVTNTHITDGNISAFPLILVSYVIILSSLHFRATV